MQQSTDDLRICAIHHLSTPTEIMREYPVDARVAETVTSSRHAMHEIIAGRDDRVIVVVGPCSIHDIPAALEYAERLGVERTRLQDTLEIVMRVYFEKPRTTVGWKGLINDPDLDGSFRIDRGLRQALRDINGLGLPAGCEFLDMITPQYITDLVAWGAIGARTTESQVHRQLASGLSCPIGFKNGTDGNLEIAAQAVYTASQPHHFMAVTKEGRAAIATTAGNTDCHIILRGGRVPNHDARGVDAACMVLDHAGLPTRVMIDASHANSGKLPQKQLQVIEDIAARIERGEHRIMGVMAESHLVAGRQDLQPGRPLRYGQSITDACIGWDDTVGILDRLADAVRGRRAQKEARVHFREQSAATARATP